MGGRGALDPEGLGTLLNTIDITPVGGRKAAETAMAPGSQNSSQRNYYVVDRGVAGEGDGDWPLRWLAKSFENTTALATGWLQVACIATTLRDPSAPAR